MNSFAILLYGTDKDIPIEEIRLRLACYMILNEHDLTSKASMYPCFQQISFLESLELILTKNESLNQMHILAFAEMLQMDVNVMYPDIPG